jgi:hypothetical protein
MALTSGQWYSTKALCDRDPGRNNPAARFLRLARGRQGTCSLHPGSGRLQQAVRGSGCFELSPANVPRRETVAMLERVELECYAVIDDKGLSVRESKSSSQLGGVFPGQGAGIGERGSFGRWRPRAPRRSASAPAPPE